MLVRMSLLLYVSMSLLGVSLSEEVEQLLAQNPCSNKKACSDCMQTPSCAWCFAHDFNGPRCFDPSMEGGTAGCDEASVFNPDNQQSIDPMWNRELTKGGAENLVLFKPQRVKLQLRMNQMQKMSFSYYYAQAKDYPVNLRGSSSGDSDSVVRLVRKQYNKITSLIDTSSHALQISYYSSCLGSKDNVVQTNSCDGLKVNDVVEFTVAITLKECPRDPRKWKQDFAIFPLYLGMSESLIVEVEMMCDCPCEHPGHYAYDDSPEICNGQGISECGVCVCKPGHFGNNCECYTDGEVPLEPERGCRPTNATSGPLCSNRGTCFCGACACDIMEDPFKVISGPYCECDNFTCDMNQGQICSGPDHGECVCGKCNCRPEFTGPACN